MSQRGFTIIEMLVVVAIVAILPTIVIANFPKIKLQFALSRAVVRFAQDARATQDKSLASVQYKDTFGVQQPISGYGVYIDLVNLGNKKYLIYADAAPGNQRYDALDYVVQTIDFGKDEPGIVITQIENVFGSTASINFSPPNPATTLTQLNQGQNSLNVIFAAVNDTSLVKKVSVNTAGLIEIK